MVALSNLSPYYRIMFKNYKAYQDGVKRVKELQDMERYVSLPQNETYELEVLMDAVMQYEDIMDAEARAEYEFMVRFEERFLDTMER